MIIVEENFEEIFKHLYEHEFTDNIFSPNESMITKDDFITAIVGDMDELAKCNWIFSPLKLRNILMQHVNFEDYKEFIDD